MRTPTIVRVFLSLMVATVVVASCHDPESAIPTSPSAPAFASAEIVAPASIAPGQSVQLAVNARTTDGAVKAISSVTWISGNSDVLKVSSTGLATGQQVRGEALVRANVTLGKLSSIVTRTVLVMPDGTFRVAGGVGEDDTPSLPVPAATVETTTGEASTTTDSSGQYRLYGVPATADIRVSHAGYTTQIRHVTLSANSTQNFLLALDGPRLGLSGNYTLTLDAGSGCQSFPTFAPNVSSTLRHRTYDATISQVGADITVLLTESRFRLNSLGLGNRFTGRALGGGATFELNFFSSYYYPFYGPASYPVAEALSDGTFLVPAGTATVTGSASGLSGTLNGNLTQWDRNFPHTNSNTLAYCSGDMQFILTPK